MMSASTIMAKSGSIVAFLILLTTMSGCSSSTTPVQEAAVVQPATTPADASDSTEPGPDSDADDVNTDQPAAEAADTADTESVYYFIALHIDPVKTAADFLDSFDVLQAQVVAADVRGIRLTLMFTSSVAKFVAHDAEALLLVQSWAAAGHEIAFHHHDVYHGSGWDGFTDLTTGEVRAIQFASGLNPGDFSYFGGLADYMTDVETMGFPVIAGCMNDEDDKRALPDAIVVDTCSGYTNTGEPGTPGNDGDAGKGVNEYVLTGIVNGIVRRSLSHEIIDTNATAEAQTDFNGMTSGVFGGMTHSGSAANLSALETFLEFLHGKDPDATKSRTLYQVIDESLLPEKALPS